MSFIEVELSNWDCNKVKVGITPKGKTATVLYEGKIPILKLCSNDSKNKYVVSSFKGLQRNMKYDSNTKKFLDIWEGDWSISFTVCKKVSEITPLQQKIVDIFADIEKKVETAFGKKPNPAIGFSYIKEKNEFGVEKKVGIDTAKGAYLKVKVGYDAPEGAKKFMDSKTGREVPVLDARFPKAKFYDIDRAKEQMLVEKPDPECYTSMNAVPKFMISLYPLNENVYITKRLMQNYYQKTIVGGDSVDEELVTMLRDNLELGE